MLTKFYQLFKSTGNDLITIEVIEILDPTIQTRKMKSIKTEGKITLRVQSAPFNSSRFTHDRYYSKMTFN